MNEGNPVKSAVAAHWNRRAPTFDSDFGHSIVTADERAAWDRIFGLISGGRSGLRARCRLRHGISQLRAGGSWASRDRD